MTTPIRRQSYLIKSELPIIMSASSATAGIHRSLDYLRGSCFLGIVASQLYSTLEENTFTVFHSGKVRFLDALPTRIVANNIFEVSYPVPMCLHSYKGEQYVLDNGYIDANKVFDTSSYACDKQRQPVQLRGFNITASGFRVIPQQHYQLRTAIDRENPNVAADSQLFGYESNDKNQYYYLSIEADRDISDYIWDKILACMPARAGIGRSSSSAGYGKVSITPINHNADTNGLSRRVYASASELSHTPNGNQLTLWLISDMQLLKHGQPTLIPEPQLLGLPTGSIWLADKSFLRSSRFSARNNYRKCYDKERQVISRGSVLRYRLPDQCDAATRTKILQHCQAGLGLQRESGFGQVVVNPQMLEKQMPQWLEPLPFSIAFNNDILSANTKPQRPQESRLIAYLENQSLKTELGNQPNKKATAIFAALCAKISQARDYQGLVKGMPLQPLPPKRTQFGRLKEAAHTHRHNANTLLAFICGIDADDFSKLNNMGKKQQQVIGMLSVATENETTNRQNNANYSKAGWEIKYAPRPDAGLGRFLTEQIKQLHKTIINEVSYDDSMSAAIADIYFSQVVAEFAVLGLSHTWEEYCLGIKTFNANDMLSQENDNAS